MLEQTPVDKRPQAPLVAPQAEEYPSEPAFRPAGREVPVALEPYRGETYYGMPALNHSHYRWRTATAFLFNGVAGGSQILATLVDFLGSDKDRAVVRAGRLMAFSGGSLSSFTLISSLHKWQRWYNMLRIVKRTSPMSLGIWAITPFTALSGLSVGGQILEDLGYRDAGRWIGRLSGVPAALLGGIVISYMGTELEETNMPVWASAHPLMSPLYAAAGLANATAALQLTTQMADTSDGMQRRLSGFALVANSVELILAALVDRRWHRMPEAAGIAHSPYASLFRAGFKDAGCIVPLGLRAFDAMAGGGGLSTLASMTKLAGGWLMQMALVYAGRESGRHPRDYFAYTQPKRLMGGNGAAGDEQIAPAVHREPVLSREPDRSRSSSFMIGAGLLAFGAALFIATVVGKKGESR